MLYVYKQLGTLPDTLTQLYEVFILYTIKHYKNKIFQDQEHEIDNDQIEHANTIKHLPTEIIKCLNCVSEIAFTGMTQDKLVFEYIEVTKERGALSLGLLNLIKCTGVLEAHYYQFLHLTIQEFLAARHIALTKSNEDKLEFISSTIGDNRFRMTLLFLSGLTQLDFLPVEQAFPAPNSIDCGVEHQIYEIKRTPQQKYKMSRFLFLAHLQNESRQTTYNWLLPCLVTNSLNLSEQSLSQFDCLVLANFLALTPEDHVWDEIILSRCSLTNDCFKIIVTKKHSQSDIPVLCLTKQLDVTTNKIDAEDLLVPLLSEESKVENLSIPSYESCTKLGGAIVKGLKKYVNIKFCKHTARQTSVRHRIHTVLSNREMIVPTDSKTCSGILTKIFKYIRPEDLKLLLLDGHNIFEDCPDCSGSGREAFKMFCNVIENSKHIQRLHIHKRHFNTRDISLVMAALQNKRNLHTLQITGSKISHKGLIHLRNYLPVNVCANISTPSEIKMDISVHNDNLLHVDIELPDDNNQNFNSDYLFPPLLEEELPQELHGVIVTTKSFMSKALLRSVGNSKMVTTLRVANLSEKKFTKYAGDFRDMLKTAKSLQTLKLHSCKLNDTSIKQLKVGLSLNEAVELNLSSYEYTLMNEIRHLSEMITTCKQLRVLKLHLHAGDNSDTFFHALSDNQNLRELRIETTGKMMVLLFQTLPSTSITTLDLSKFYESEGLGNKGSLAFKDFIHRNKVLTVLRANECGLTDEAFNGITFTHKSPLRELSLSDNVEVDEGWTELFHGLCSSCITTLDVMYNRLHGEECCTALKCLLVNNKTLTVLRVGNYMREANDDIVCCIADALSQKCSLRELTIREYTLTRLNLFESLYDNTTLNTLNCRNVHLPEDKPNNDVAKSVCEMLQHNQGIKNLTIPDELIEGYLKEFAMAYIRRKSVLNLKVGTLVEQLVNEIEELETDKEYNITSDIKLPRTIIEWN